MALPSLASAGSDSTIAALTAACAGGSDASTVGPSGRLPSPHIAVGSLASVGTAAGRIAAARLARSATSLAASPLVGAIASPGGRPSTPGSNPALDPPTDASSRLDAVAGPAASSTRSASVTAAAAAGATGAAAAGSTGPPPGCGSSAAGSTALRRAAAHRRPVRPALRRAVVHRRPVRPARARPAARRRSPAFRPAARGPWGLARRARRSRAGTLPRRPRGRLPSWPRCDRAPPAIAARRPQFLERHPLRREARAQMLDRARRSCHGSCRDAGGRVTSVAWRTTGPPVVGVIGVGASAVGITAPRRGRCRRSRCRSVGRHADRPLRAPRRSGPRGRRPFGRGVRCGSGARRRRTRRGGRGVRSACRHWARLVRGGVGRGVGLGGGLAWLRASRAIRRGGLDCRLWPRPFDCGIHAGSAPSLDAGRLGRRLIVRRRSRSCPWTSPRSSGHVAPTRRTSRRDRDGGRARPIVRAARGSGDA